MASLEIRLKRPSKIYEPGDVISGVLSVTCKSISSHQGIKITISGNTYVGDQKTTEVMREEIDVAQGPGKLPPGKTEIPFECPLEASEGKFLYETYHGVLITTQYTVQAEVIRTGMFTRSLKRTAEFVVHIPGSDKAPESKPLSFTVTPGHLENADINKSSIVDFRIVGKLDSSICDINEPLAGEIVVEKCEERIRAIELQLVRVETIALATGANKESTEVQSLQLVDGNVRKGTVVPIHLIFPRIFTCATVLERAFKIEFELNVIVLLEDEHVITENFPIKLFRK